MGTTTSVVLQDLAGSIRKLPLAARMAFDDIQGKYRRTALGPLWIVVGQAAFLFGFLVVFAVLFGIDRQSYALYLAASFPVWNLISNPLSEMPNAFVQSRGFIESFELPWLLQIWRRAFANLIVFFHQIVVLFGVMLVLQVPPSWTMLWAIPGLLVITIFAVGAGTGLAVFGARFRDLAPTMGVVTRFLFFFSAVMWRPEQLSENRWIIELNPLFHLLQMVREPLIGIPPNPWMMLATTVGALVVFALGVWIFGLGRRRLYHWL